MSNSKTFKAVYVGLRQGTSNPLLAVWLKLDADGNLTDEQLAFAKKGKKSKLTDAWIGDVRAITEDDGGFGVAAGSAEQWPDLDQRRQQKLDEGLAEAAVAYDKDAAKLDYGETTLAELRSKWHKTIGRTRRAVLLALIETYITS